MFSAFLAKLVAAKIAGFIAAIVAAVAALLGAVGDLSPGGGSGAAQPTPTVAVTASPAPTTSPTPTAEVVATPPITATPEPATLTPAAIPAPTTAAPVAHPSLRGLCTSLAHKNHMIALTKSTAFKVLINTAGSKDDVAAYCASTFGIAVAAASPARTPDAASKDKVADPNKTPCPNHWRMPGASVDYADRSTNDGREATSLRDRSFGDRSYNDGRHHHYHRR